MVQVTPVSSRPVTITVSGTPADHKEGLVLVVGVVPIRIGIGTSVVHVPIDIETLFVRRHAGVASAQSAPVTIPEAGAVLEIYAPPPIPFVPLTMVAMQEGLVRNYGPDLAKQMYGLFSKMFRDHLSRSVSGTARQHDPPAAHGGGAEGED
jgi:hypothetical protein